MIIMKLNFKSNAIILWLICHNIILNYTCALTDKILIICLVLFNKTFIFSGTIFFGIVNILVLRAFSCILQRNINEP